MARKGDLAVLRLRRSDTSADHHVSEHESFEVGIVESANRQGRVLTVRDTWGTVRRADAYDVRQVIVEPRASVDVAAVIEAAKAHHWPGHPSQPMPYDTLGDVVEMARPFRR